jgi:hypothetical protein
MNPFFGCISIDIHDGWREISERKTWVRTAEENRGLELKEKTIRNGRRRLLKFTFRWIMKAMRRKSSVRLCHRHNIYRRYFLQDV